MLNGFNAKVSKAPPIIIALRLNDAAKSIGVSVNYLKQAIRDGKLPMTVKKPAGKERGIKLILVEELRRFAATSETGEEETQDGQ